MRFNKTEKEMEKTCLRKKTRINIMEIKTITTKYTHSLAFHIYNNNLVISGNN